METEFDRFMSDPKARELFEKEYNAFLLSELLLEKMESEKISAEALAQMAKVSPTVIKNMQRQKTEKVNYGDFTNIINTLGYRINLEKK